MRQVILVSSDGTVNYALPAAQTLSFGERVISEELPGNDQVNAVITMADAVEWELEHGGISLEAYALMTGRTAVLSGTTPSRTYHLQARSRAAFPYFKIYGKALGDSIDDIHVKIPKAKINDTIEGELADGKFWVTKCKGIAIDNGTYMWEFIQNETAAALPTT